MKVVVIDYGAGNVKSVQFALERLGINPILTKDSEQIEGADKVIFPGVGHAASAMEALKRDNLIATIQNLRQPVLGICLGMQLLGTRSEEGDTECLGIVDLPVLRFQSNTMKIPQMGWNRINGLESKLFDGINEEYVYYVNSYYMPFNDNYTIASSNYIETITGALKKDNFYGCQFHPEKSGLVGSKILKNFIEKCE